MGKQMNYERPEQRRSDIFDKLGCVSGIALVVFAAWAAFYNPAQIPRTQAPYNQAAPKPKAPIEKKIEAAQPFVTPKNIYDPRNAIIVGDQADGSYVGEDDITKLLEKYGLTRDRIKLKELEQK